MTSFDPFAADYDTLLRQGTALSGESPAYFAAARVAWLAGCLQALAFTPRRVVDFGCGTGGTARLLLGLPGAEQVLGLDPSPRSIKIASDRHAARGLRFEPIPAGLAPGEPADLVYCSGVMHHVPPAERPATLREMHARLRSGGLLALWENNPWSPGARLVMWRIPFDRGARMLPARRAARLLAAAGFRPVRTDFLFVFPAWLRIFRPLEARLRRWPLGAQYQVLARRD
jgi:SAM-dependent methyltransferase